MVAYLGASVGGTHHLSPTIIITLESSSLPSVFATASTDTDIAASDTNFDQKASDKAVSALVYMPCATTLSD